MTIDSIGLSGIANPLLDRGGRQTPQGIQMEAFRQTLESQRTTGEMLAVQTRSEGAVAGHLAEPAGTDAPQPIEPGQLDLYA